MARTPEPSTLVQLGETPVVALLSVKIGETVIDPLLYTLDSSRGMVYIDPEAFYNAELWPSSLNLVIEYSAGYNPLPADLQMALNNATATMSNSAAPLPPGVRSMDIPDVGSIQMFDPKVMYGGAALLPALAPYAQLLDGYRDTGRFYQDAAMIKLEKIRDLPVPP
jgi:hypothetical protein